MKRALLLVLGLVFSLAAYAITCTQYRAIVTGFGGTWADNRAAAISSLLVNMNESSAGCTSTTTYGGVVYSTCAKYKLYGTPTDTAFTIINENDYCLARFGGYPACGTSYSGGYETRTGDYCTIACEAGLTAEKNLTIGYDRSPNSSNTYPDLDAGGLPWSTSSTFLPTGPVCINGCQWSAGTVVEAWVSTEPTDGGLYRSSADVSMSSLGVTCTETSGDDNRAKPTQTPPACDGTTGYINGKKVCVGASESHVNVMPRTGNVKQGNPAASSTGTLADIPATGGNGGNKGGPPGTADGAIRTPSGTIVTPSPTVEGSGTKTSTAGEEQLNCGAPGQPKCRIDETGTPTSKELKLDEATINAAAASNRGTISGSGDKGMFGSWTGVFVTPPVVACEATSFTMQGGQTVSSNPCPVVEGTRSVVGWLWALSGFWLCLGWIRESV